MNGEQAKQSCGQVQSLLLAYLDGEVTPSERELILAHLSGCTVCQQELDLLSTARSQIRSALQRRASQAIPSQEAWSRLEARLTESAQPSSSKFAAWFSRKAPRVSRASNQLFGGVTMRKRWIFSGLVGVIALSILAVLMAQSVTPVSARQILDRAYAVQTQQAAKQGIQHIRSEIYTNIEGSPEKPGMDTTIESYVDLQSGNARLVVTDNQTGRVLQVYAYDGSNSYSSDSPKDGQPSDDPLTIYRSPQNQPSELGRKLRMVGDKELDAKTMFDKMRSDPQVQFVGEEAWDNGRRVYVLNSVQPIKIMVEEQLQTPIGLVTMYFDVDTYDLLGTRVTMEKDGQELLIMSQRILVDEILPEGSNVAWDLSDVTGITIVDDLQGEHVKLPPEVISEQQLASYSKSAYLLSSVPPGFTLEISAAPNQPEDQPFSYAATYHNEAGDFLMIESVAARKVKFMEEGMGESYTTAGGLKLTFIENPKGSSGKEFTTAVVETPEGAGFIITSTLPLEQVKELAETLVLVK